MATHSPLVKPIGLVGVTLSGETMRIVKTQCHTTTTTSDSDRKKSTYGSRSVMSGR